MYAFRPDHWGAAGKPIVKIKELKAGITADTPRNPGNGILAKYDVRDGDVLFSWSADLDTYLWMGGRSALDQVFSLLPPVTLRKRFEVLVEPMHRQLITLTKHVRNLRQTRDLLLPRLLSGQQPLKPLDP